MAIDALSNRSMNAVKENVATPKSTATAAAENTKAAAYAKAQGTSAAPEAPSRADAVVLTDSAKSLSRATARAKASDGIDSAKVEKLKAAINDGSYKINYESVASKLIDSEDELSSIFG
ncbi:MAG: flagellar biosynthesis anti-sigma factor FlgM [Succinivibrio sp.]|jgi:negative regulator of flagellin synthesis FlgM|nr:flagellar biosynthesis anti-sigma factor FlgM [Succinivibrio sp.]